MAQPGDILAGRWRLIEPIDAGAMGVIFRGSHHLLGHPVAVKVLLPDIARDPRAIERFLREAQIAARLRHRNVVRVEDFGLDAAEGPDAPTTPFLVMELLHGESLARRLARPPRLSARQVVAVVQQIGAALDAAHGAGIVHRDLKPENIFLARDIDGASSPEPVVKVLDFGVAKFADLLAAGGGATASNTLVGTPRYMSPEQARSSRSLDGRSDLWALGLLTYEMLTGSHPFEGEAIAELLVAILTHRIAPPSALRPELPTALDAFMEKALARPRHERFATGRALSDALREALADCPQDAWPVETARAPAHDPRRGTVRVPRPQALPPPPPDDDATPLPRTTARARRPSRPSLPDLVAADLAADLAAPPLAPAGQSEADASPPATVASKAPDRPSHPPGVLRSAGWAVLAVAALASLGLLAVARKSPWRPPVAPATASSTPPPLPQPAPAAEAPAPVLPPPSGAAATPPAVVPPPTAQDAGVASPGAPAAAAEPDAPLPRRSRHRRHRHRHAPRTPEGATPQGGSVYDPDAV